jgi:hypothetical protein
MESNNRAAFEGSGSKPYDAARTFVQRPCPRSGRHLAMADDRRSLEVFAGEDMMFEHEVIVDIGVDEATFCRVFICLNISIAASRCRGAGDCSSPDCWPSDRPPASARLRSRFATYTRLVGAPRWSGRVALTLSKSHR